MASHQVSQEEELIGLLEVMVVGGLGPLGVDLPELCLHGVDLGVVVALLGVLEGEPVILALLLVWVEVLFGQSGDGLHFPLFEFALAVVQLVLDALVLLHEVVPDSVLLLELMEVDFRVVLSQLSHSDLLLFPFLLLLLSEFHGLLLVHLQLLVFEFLWR